MEINVGLMLSLMEKHGAHSEILRPDKQTR